MNKAISMIFVLAAAGFATAAAAQDAKAGEKKAAMCIGCHGIPGYQASFPEIHKVPTHIFIGGSLVKNNILDDLIVKIRQDCD